MRTKLILLFTCSCTLHLFAQNTIQPSQFIFTGKVIGSNAPKIYLSYKNKEGKRIMDSCILKDGDFSFTGYIDEPTSAFAKTTTKIMEDATNMNFTGFFIEPGVLSAVFTQDHFKEVKIIGSKTQQEAEQLEIKFDSLRRNPATFNAKNFMEVVAIYSRAHPGSYLSVNELGSYMTRWPLDTLQKLYDHLDITMRNTTRDGKAIGRYLTQQYDNGAGRMAQEFSSKDINGKMISMTGFKGKYVILDFWGSWCAPCRASTPHLLALFNNYHNKGLEVIAIAEEYYDKSGKEWKDAIKKDGTEIWYNVLNDESRSIVEKFGVHSFPTKFLVDADGKIVGRYNGDQSADLDKALAGIFK